MDSILPQNRPVDYEASLSEVRGFLYNLPEMK